MNLKDRFLSEFDGKGKVFSALVSVLTLFAVLGQIAPEFYEKMPVYSEWICGVTTWNAYNKQGDMWIVQTSLIGLPVLFLLFGWIYVLWKRLVGEGGKTPALVFTISYLAVLAHFFMEKNNAWQWLFLWVCLFTGYLILGNKKQTGLLADLFVHVFVAMFAVVAILLGLSGFSVGIAAVWNSISVWIPVASGVLFVFFSSIDICRKKVQILGWLQLLLPLAWLGFIHFRYRCEKDNSLVELFYSGRWKWMCVCFCVVCLVWAVAEKIKTKHVILFPTYIMAAVIRVFSQPEGMLNIDYFHNGEITMPMQQLVSYGKLPYVDVIPIHGLCDYYYGLIDYLFFDGTYLALNAAKVAGDLLMAVFLATVIYFFVENQYQALATVYLFIPFMIEGAGMRYWFMFVLFLVMFSKKTSKGMQCMYAWIVLSMVAIAWNASIGGAAAVSFLPLALYRFLRDVKTQWRELCYCLDKRKKALTWTAWGLLIVAGIAFVPLFLKIVTYLRENTGTTLYVNGMEMLEDVSEATGYLVPGLINAQGDFWIVCFAFLIPLLIVFALCLGGKTAGAGEMFVTYLIAFYVLANYAFVRYDNGLRAGVLGVFFLLLTAVTLLWKLLKERIEDRSVTVSLYASVIALAVLLSADAPFVTADTLVLEKNVPEYVETLIMGQEIDDPVLHVSGELVSIPNLGTGFIQGNTLASLQNVNTLMQAAAANGQTVFDITNAVADAVLLDMPLYLPYSSAYNISNGIMQENAISMLKEKLPDIILAAPEIRFDDAPFSYRSMKLYRYLMSQDYIPYKYQNVIYLVRGENPLPDAKQDDEAFAQLMHKKELAYLPAVWGNSMSDTGESPEKLDVQTEVAKSEEGYRIVFDRPVSGRELGMIGIKGLSCIDEEAEVVMRIESAVSAEQEVQFSFALRGDRYLVPVCTSPYVMWQERITCVEITSDMWENISADAMEVNLYQ